MSEASIQIVKQGFERYAAGDIPGFLELVSTDIQWDHRGPDGVPFNKLFQGREGVVEFFKLLDETSEPLTFEPREYFAAGDRVVALGFFRYKVKATGKEWESDWAMAFTVQNGRMTHWRGIFDMGAEAAAFQPSVASRTR